MLVAAERKLPQPAQMACVRRHRSPDGSDAALADEAPPGCRASPRAAQLLYTASGGYLLSNCSTLCGMLANTSRGKVTSFADEAF